MTWRAISGRRYLGAPRRARVDDLDDPHPRRRLVTRGVRGVVAVLEGVREHPLSLHPPSREQLGGVRVAGDGRLDEGGGVHAGAVVWRRNLNLKAEVESSISHFSFKRLVPGAFNTGLIGSTCAALPLASTSVAVALASTYTLPCSK